MTLPIKILKVRSSNTTKSHNMFLLLLMEREPLLDWSNPVWKAQLTNWTEKTSIQRSQWQLDYKQLTTRPLKVKVLCVCYFSRPSKPILLSRGLIKWLWKSTTHKIALHCFISVAAFIQTRLPLMVGWCITDTSTRAHHGGKCSLKEQVKLRQQYAEWSLSEVYCTLLNKNFILLDYYYYHY